MKHLDRETEKRLNIVVKAIGTLFILSFLAHLVISSWRDDQYGFTLLALIAGGALVCSGQVKLATVLESFQYKRSDSFGVNPPLY